MNILMFNPYEGTIECNDKKITPQQAQTIIQEEKYDCNLAFNRLIAFDFNVEETLRSYEDDR